MDQNEMIQAVDHLPGPKELVEGRYDRYFGCRTKKKQNMHSNQWGILRWTVSIRVINQLRGRKFYHHCSYASYLSAIGLIFNNKTASHSTVEIRIHYCFVS